jgi:predicted  nucleic acid-binding Zn-ribbon protein
MRRCAVLTVCLLFLSASFARAEFYRWVDREGKEFFTNDREQVPQEYRNNAVAVKPDERRVSVGEKSGSTRMPSAALKDHKDKYGKGEEHWRKRAAKLRKELAALQDKYDLFLKQEREDENKPKRLTVKNSSNKKISRSSREKKKETLEKDVAQKKHELEVELPEEARKADAYPGWLRE